MSGLATITVLSPLRDDAAVVSRRLAHVSASSGDSSGGDAGSPFAASDRTHFARLLVLPAPRPRQLRPRGMRRPAVLLDLLTHLGREQAEDELPAACLVFTAAYDDDPRAPYVEHLRQSLGPAADRIWSGCEGYPGRDDPARFADFLARGTMPAGYEFTPAHRATVTDVVGALRVRQGVIAMATRDGADTATRRREIGALLAAAEGVAGRPAPVTAAALAVGDQGETEAWNRSAHRSAETYLQRDPLRRPATRLQPADLADVQGLTVGYGRHRAGGYLTARITDRAAARTWLAGVRVTSAAQAGAGTPGEVGDVAVNVALSASGLERLGVSATDRDGFDPSFRAGMGARAGALDPATGTRSWETHFIDGVDLLVHLSAVDAATLMPALARHQAELVSSGGFAAVVAQPGERIVVPESGYGGFVEHFGFADGLSQPAIEGLPRGSSGTGRRTDGDLLPPGELLLGYRDVDGGSAGDVAPPWLARNGSYLVYRKLEQDVAAFRAMAGDSAAKLVGRTTAGQPLSPSDGSAVDLSFAADAEGFGCPVGSHVRRVNPRDSMPLDRDAARPHDSRLEQRLVRRHRMLRRGLPYGPVLPPGVTEDAPPPGGRGLLFVALVGDIGRQFEFVQTQWMNDGNAFRLGRDADAFAGVTGSKVTVQGCPPGFVRLDRPVVTCRGGEYFLMPGLAALRRLAGL